MRDPTLISACDVCLTGFIDPVPDRGFDCRQAFCNGLVRPLKMAVLQSEWDTMKPAEKLDSLLPEPYPDQA